MAYMVLRTETVDGVKRVYFVVQYSGGEVEANSGFTLDATDDDVTDRLTEYSNQVEAEYQASLTQNDSE